MIIDCIADLHGYYPVLEGGDLLIVAGDITARDTVYEHADFQGWLNLQPYKKKIFIAGNHDNNVDKEFSWDKSVEYLCDSGTEYEGLRIWGSPWTKTFPGMNPKCKAFTCDTEEELAEKWEMIPDDIDILITHGPSQGVLDEVKRDKYIENVGSESLIKPMIKSGCRLHIFGHIHESYGKFHNPILGITYINCSHVNQHYEPVNKPVRIEL